MFLFYLTLLILAYSVEQSSAHGPITALSFGKDIQSYMMLQLDMEPVKEAISICSWINKKTADGAHDAWFTYNAPSRIHEILIAGRIRGWSYMNKAHIANNQAVPSNEWHHICITWGYETKTRVLYFDGKAIAQQASGDVKLTMGGSIAIGQYHTKATMEAIFNNGHWFGGELLKLNVYKRQLEAGEVGKMFSSGMCSDFEDSLVGDAFLRWETILYATERHGTITEVPITCPGDHWNVLYFTDFYNKVVDDEILKKMEDQFEVLEEFRGHKIDEPLIQHLRDHH